MRGLWAILICGAVTAASQAHAQAAPDLEEWVCSVRDPEAPDPHFFFDVTLRVNNKDFRASLEIPLSRESAQENTTVHYALMENDAVGIHAIAKVPDRSATRFRIRILLVNKADGGFRAGATTTDGSNTHFTGTCKRK